MSHLAALVANGAKSVISEGTGRMTVFASSAQARTFDYQAGDIGESSPYPRAGYIYSRATLGYVPASFGMVTRL